MRGGRRVDLLSIIKQAAAKAESLETVMMYSEENDRSNWGANFYELSPEGFLSISH